MGMFSDNPRPVVEFDPEGPRAKQSFKDECDINVIMKKYRTSGLISHVSKNAGRFADVSEIGSYQDAIHRVRGARKFFLGLPASLREEFKNDAAIFLDFVSDPSNEKEIRRLGLEKVVLPAPPEVDPPVLPPDPADLDPPPEED